VEVQLQLAGFCPSCGEPATFRPIGDQEMLDGPPVALGNCSACGSTVALAQVGALIEAGWSRAPVSYEPHAGWEAQVSAPVDGSTVTITAHCDCLKDLLSAVRAAHQGLAAMRPPFGGG
jgi:hypothetical protein